MNPLEIIFQSLDVVIESQLWPDKKPSEVLRILMYVHTKGWLYTPTVDGEIQAVIAAYRIKEVTDESLVKTPVKEEGTILYIPFVVSLNEGKNIYSIVRESLNQYLEANPDITELVLEDKNNQIKRYNIKGVQDGQEQDASVTSTANISK